MAALLLAVLLGQASVEIRVRVVKPLCVVVETSGATTVVPKRALEGGERVAGCAPSGGNTLPRVEQLAENGESKERAGQRVIQISY